MSPRPREGVASRTLSQEERERRNQLSTRYKNSQEKARIDDEIRGIRVVQMKIKKAGWPRPRLPHQHESRENQAWAQKKEWVEGIDAFGNKKKFLVESGHFRCDCGQIIYIRKGFAICDGCGLCFNDGPETTSLKTKKKLEGAFRRKCSNKSFI